MIQIQEHVGWLVFVLAVVAVGVAAGVTLAIRKARRRAQTEVRVEGCPHSMFTTLVPRVLAVAPCTGTTEFEGPAVTLFVGVRTSAGTLLRDSVLFVIPKGRRGFRLVASGDLIEPTLSLKDEQGYYPEVRVAR